MRELRALDLCGLHYRVFLATPEEIPVLATEEGLTDYASNTIYLRESLAPSRLRDTLVHEVAHAFLEGSGLASLLAAKVKDKDPESFEELFIRILVPHLLRAVDVNGRALCSIPPVEGEGDAR